LTKWWGSIRIVATSARSTSPHRLQWTSYHRIKRSRPHQHLYLAYRHQVAHSFSHSLCSRELELRRVKKDWKGYHMNINQRENQSFKRLTSAHLAVSTYPRNSEALWRKEDIIADDVARLPVVDVGRTRRDCQYLIRRSIPSVINVTSRSLITSCLTSLTTSRISKHACFRYSKIGINR